MALDQPREAAERQAAATDLKGKARYCRDSADIDAALLLSRLYDSLADLLRRRGVGTPRRPPPACGLPDKHLFWLDSDYRDAKGKTTEMGGVAGRLRLAPPRPLPLSWWRLLVLGQHTGIGQRVAFGWGRYQLMTPDGLFSYRRPLAAHSLPSRCRKTENLIAAWNHVNSGIDLPSDADLDEETDEEPPEAPLERLQADFDKMLAGAYQPPTLRGYLLEK